MKILALILILTSFQPFVFAKSGSSQKKDRNLPKIGSSCAEEMKAFCDKKKALRVCRCGMWVEESYFECDKQGNAFFTNTSPPSCPPANAPKPSM